MSRARQRLQAIQNALTSTQHRTSPADDDDDDLLVLPTGKNLTFATSDSSSTHILLDACVYRVSSLNPPTALTINGIGTPHEHTATHVPRYPVLEISDDGDDGGRIITPADTWFIIYALFTRYHTQETIPVLLASSIQNRTDVRSYVLGSGLGRTAPRIPGNDHDNEDDSPLFLLRTAFWQGAGTLGYHADGWLPPSPSLFSSSSSSPSPYPSPWPFPSVQSFTRTPLVITAHPLRPPKPHPGQVLYRRFCPTVGQVLELTYFDLDGAGWATASTGDTGTTQPSRTTSAHLSAFHKWHNDERVNKGWNERGTLDHHRAYVQRAIRDPAVLPVMMSWDGELMGYVEIVWLKENHAATFVPQGVGEWDRGIHVLTGEEKFRGWERAQAWLRSLHHYIFLADPRTSRVFGEPKADNAAIVQVSLDATMHIETIFDFPYKRSVLTCMPRERFFKLDVL
ncbi:acyl-CoA N-acyltransferase [Phlebopus sp. FC_14]|nr:acyl-CoA N-acyltransferase [Phlebopus sp. FC_14]